jgi:hypothetical protein
VIQLQPIQNLGSYLKSIIQFKYLIKNAIPFQIGEKGHKPEQRVVSQDRFKVLPTPQIVRRDLILLIRLRPLFTILNRRAIIAQKVNMEGKEASHNEAKSSCEDVRGQNIVGEGVGYGGILKNNLDEGIGDEDNLHRGEGGVEKHV